MIGTSKSIWGFDPRSVGGCALWFDAADQNTITLSGGNVTQWNDKSGNGYSVIQPTSSNRPTYTTNLLNGLPGIQLTNTTYLYQIGSNISTFSSSPSTTVFMVAKNGSSFAGSGWNIVNTMWFIGNAAGTARYHLSFGENTTNAVTLYGIEGARVGAGGTIPLNTAGIIGFTITATGNSINVNGSLTNFVGATARNANNGTWFVFGDPRGSTLTNDINVYEFIGFNTDLTTSQRQQVEGYLAWKWGINSSLPSVSYVAPLSTVGFTPTSISNCVLWNDASTLTGSGAVGTWTNPQGGYTVSCTGTKTAAGRNGLNTVSLTTAQTWIPSPEVSLNAYTLFWSGRKTSTTGGRVLQGAGNNQLYGYWSTVEKVIYIDGDPNVLTGPTVDSAWDTFSHARIASGAFVFNWNGVLHYSNATSGSVGMNGLRINSGASPSETSACEIGEIILYNRSLTRTEISTVDAYLMNKWGISNAGVPTFNTANPYFYIKPHLRAFQPNTIQGCTLWLDAADSSTITLSSGNMTQWRDKSGFGNTMTYFSTFSNATVSTAFQNGLNVLNFSGNGLYRSPASSAVYPLDGYFVLALKDTTTRVDVFGMGATSIDNFNSLTFGEYIASRWHNGSTGFSRTPNCIAPSNETSTSFLLIQWSIANNNFLLRRNGALLDQTPSYTFTLTAGSIFQIGLRYPHYSTGALTELFKGYLGEIVVFNRQLNDGEREQIEGYLSWKWGINRPVVSNSTLPTSIPNCALWIDATQDTAADNAALTTILDRSANGKNLTTISPGTVTLQKNYKSGNAVYNFATTRASNASFSWGTSFTHFVVSSSANGAWLNSAGSLTTYVNPGNWAFMNVNSSRDFQDPGSITAWSTSGGATASIDAFGRGTLTLPAPTTSAFVISTYTVPISLSRETSFSLVIPATAGQYSYFNLGNGTTNLQFLLNAGPTPVNLFLFFGGFPTYSINPGSDLRVLVKNTTVTITIGSPFSTVTLPWTNLGFGEYSLQFYVLGNGSGATTTTYSEIQFDPGKGFSVFPKTTGTASQWNILSAGYSSGSTTMTNYTVNGVPRSTSWVVSPYSGTTPDLALYINGSSSFNYDSTYFGEIIHYNRSLTVSERQQVEQYLANKWRIPNEYSFTRFPPASIASRSISSFSPRSISGLALWLDAVDPAGTGVVPANGATLSTWVDKSGNGRNATGVSSPTYSLSTNRVTMNGTSYFTLPNGTMPTGNSFYTIFFVGSSSLGGYQGILTSGPSANNQGVTTYYYPNGQIEAGWYANNFTAPAGTVTANTLGIISTGYTTSLLDLYFNGVLVGSKNPGATNAGATSPNYLGRDIGGTQVLNGTIAEVIIYTSYLTTDQRQQIEGYLAWKWKIPTILSLATSTFNFTGSIQSWTAPAGITSATVTLRGASGGNGAVGGNVVGTMNVTPGQTYYLLVGGAGTPSGGVGGYGGGGNGNIYFGLNGGGGGGYSGIFTGSTPSQGNALVIAGGGGGGNQGNGPGAGGGNTGVTAPGLQGGGGGTQTAGGASGTSALGSGSALQGGNAVNGGAGGGGGYFGGGQGIDGGGGSGFVGGLSSVTTNSQGGGASGNGSILITTPILPSHPFRVFPPTTQVELTATGGTVVVTRDYTTYHVFTSSSNFVVVGSGRVNYLFVGGGGGGGDRHGGGGGAGGVQSGSFSVTTGTYAVTVGLGGAGGNWETNNSFPRGSGLKGGDTTISGVNTGIGGGGGGTYDGPSSGTFGSGGGGGGGAGSGNSPAPSAGTVGQGNSGGTGSNPGGGGGGGAGGAGVNADASAGGIGTAAYSVHLLAVGYGSSFAIPTGTNQVISEGVAYIAGGGGGANGFGARPPYAYGGLGGGGRGDWDNSFISAGTPNTGGGGGGSRSESGGGSAGFAGGSGLVLLWY